MNGPTALVISRWKRPALGMAVALFAFAGSAMADEVTDWNAIATRTVLAGTAAERPVMGLQVAFAQVAVFDAVNAVDGSYEPFLVRSSAPAGGASRRAAAVAAAYNTLVALFPSQQSSLLADYNASLQAIPDGIAKERGIALGADVALRVLQARSDDGRNAVVTYQYQSGPGQYVFQTSGSPAPAAAPQPVWPWLGQVRPLAMLRPSQFRPKGPPPLTSNVFEADLEEVRLLGGATALESDRGPAEADWRASTPEVLSPSGAPT